MRVATKIVVGNKVVATEQFHHMGPAQGTWWKKYSWWVIPLGVIFLVLPAINYWRGITPYVSQTQSVVSVPPTQPQVNFSPGAIVIQQPPSPQTSSASSEAKEAGDEPAPKTKPKSLWELNP